VIDEDGRAWKFCTKCVCKKTGQTGIYNLSHYDSEHKHPLLSTESNLTTLSSSSNHEDTDPLEFQGAWCASVPAPLSFFAPPLPPTPPFLHSINPTLNTAFDLLSTFPITPSPFLVDCHAPTVFTAELSPPEHTHPLDPTVFLTLCDTPTDIHPIIFDTGASLAITHSLSDFDGTLSLPKGNLCLSDMANGMQIEGLGTITWNFLNDVGPNPHVQDLAYYVPDSKARLLSPQCLFNPSTGITGYYKGGTDHFSLCIVGQPRLIAKYDPRNFLPITYARLGSPFSSTQANLSLPDPTNQNLTRSQKLLLHWHYRFGHLNLPSVQGILRGPPFLSLTFKAASKCDAHTLKCATCEYVKGHQWKNGVDSTD
jgi:hypothetical protein